MSLSSLVSATESAVRLSEAAVSAAEESMAAARLASIHANSALAAAKLALDLERRLRRDSEPTVSPSDHNPSTSQEELETKIISETTSVLSSENIGHSNHQDGAASPDRRSTPELEDLEPDEEERGESKKKKNCQNCKMYKWGCLNGKFVLKVMKKTVGMKVVGWCGPPDLVGRVGTVVGGGQDKISISWNSKKNEKSVSYDLQHQGEHAFKFFCLQNEPTPTLDEESLEESEVSEYERKLFVGGLDHSVTDQYLMEYFETFGTLTDWVVMKTQLTKQPKGYGFVTFQKPEMMENCLESQPHCLNGKVVELKKATPRAEHRPEPNSQPGEESSFESNKLFITGLEPTVTKEDLREYFEKFGKLSDWVVMIGHNAKSKCFGFVTFKSQLALEKCLKLKPHSLKGKRFELRRSVSQYPKDSAQDRNFPHKWLFAHRLPSKEAGRVWKHDPEGEKHRMRFCASENISVMGIALLVKSPIKRVTFNLCQLSGQNNDHCVIFKQDFDNVNASSVSSIVLKLRHGVRMSCDRIYLLVLTLHGGASYVGCGGEEFVTVNTGGRQQGEEVEEEVLFKFEDYKHKTDRAEQTTDVEKGLVEKIYFEL